MGEVEKAFRESVDDYLAFCKERGEEPNKPCSGQFVVRVDSELHRKAAMLAEASGVSLNAWVGAMAKEIGKRPRRRNTPGRSARAGKR